MAVPVLVIVMAPAPDTSPLTVAVPVDDGLMSRPPLPITKAPDTVPPLTLAWPVPMVSGTDTVPPLTVALPALAMVRVGLPVLLSTLPLDTVRLLIVLALLFRSSVPPLTVTAMLRVQHRGGAQGQSAGGSP